MPDGRVERSPLAATWQCTPRTKGCSPPVLLLVSRTGYTSPRPTSLATAAGGAAVVAAVAGAAADHDPAAVGAGRSVALPAVGFVEGAAVAVALAGQAAAVAGGGRGQGLLGH